MSFKEGDPLGWNLKFYLNYHKNSNKCKDAYVHEINRGRYRKKYIFVGTVVRSARNPGERSTYFIQKGEVNKLGKILFPRDVEFLISKRNRWIDKKQMPRRGSDQAPVYHRYGVIKLEDNNVFKDTHMQQCLNDFRADQQAYAKKYNVMWGDVFLYCLYKICKDHEELAKYHMDEENRTQKSTTKTVLLSRSPNVLQRIAHGDQPQGVAAKLRQVFYEVTGLEFESDMEFVEGDQSSSCSATKAAQVHCSYGAVRLTDHRTKPRQSCHPSRTHK